MRRLAERAVELPAEVRLRQPRGTRHVGHLHRLGIARIGEVACPQEMSSRRHGNHAASMPSGLAILGSLFEQLGIRGERASVALYAYAAYTIGSILIEANRRVADEAGDEVEPATRFATGELVPEDAPAIDATTALALDHAIATTRRDASVDEDPFVAGLRTLLQALTGA
jgi:hypothetical protein